MAKVNISLKWLVCLYLRLSPNQYVKQVCSNRAICDQSYLLLSFILLCAFAVHFRHTRIKQLVTSNYRVFCPGALLQGTINGIGERTGNANLITIIPTLQLKMDVMGVGEHLSNLTALSRFTDEQVSRRAISGLFELMVILLRIEW